MFYGIILAFVVLTLVVLIGENILNAFRKRLLLRDTAQYRKDGHIRLHVVSETEWITQGQGVHTAFVESLELLDGQSGLSVVVNGRGTGNIFHSHTYGPYYFLKGLRYKGRRILTAHVIPDSSKGTIPFWKILMPLTTAYLKLAYSYADVIIAISPTVEQAIQKLNTGTRIVRISNPVLKENWRSGEFVKEQTRKKYAISADDILVLGVGQLQPRKGVEDFIELAASMPQAKFLWAGGRPWGKFTENIHAIDEQIRNAPDNIQFTGLLELEAMPGIYAAADVFVFPSFQENCPLAPLEAAAAGLPVIFRDIAEYRTLYQANYLKADTVNDFKEQILKLADDVHYYLNAVKVSNDLVLEFDKDKIRSQLITLYKDIINTTTAVAALNS